MMMMITKRVLQTWSSDSAETTGPVER